jgi:hypothetical protein
VKSQELIEKTVHVIRVVKFLVVSVRMTVPRQKGSHRDGESQKKNKEKGVLIHHRYKGRKKKKARGRGWPTSSSGLK